MLHTDSTSPLFLKMTTRKRRTIYPPSRACLLVLLLLLGTCRIISADRHTKSVRGEALRRSVLDIYSFDFFASKKGKKGGMKAGKKEKKQGKKTPKKSLKLGKEKGKGKNKSKGKGKGKGALLPTPAPSGPSPPPNSIPGSPTRAPTVTRFPTPILPTVPSLAPTGAPTISEGLNVVNVQLAPYTLFYTIEQLRIPFTREVTEVVGITAAYLKIYFEEIFLDDPDTILSDFLTDRLDGDSFGFNEPYGIVYSSVAVFSIESSIVPTPGELDNLLSQAFIGQELSIYLGLLGSLPSDNLFSTTSDVTETKLPEPLSTGAAPAGSDEKSNDRSSTIPIAAATGASAFVLIILGVVLYRRRERYDELGKLGGSDMGHMTVAGETFVGNSTAYSASDALTEQHEQSVGGNRSVAWHSEWAMSTHAVSEEGAVSDQDSLSDDGSTESPPELDEHSVNENDEATIDPGNESEDEEVPVRVVDLIKMFSLSS